MAKYVKRYLANHETLAQAVFNTIIKLSEDQMEHQKYNANYLKVSKKDKEFIFKIFGIVDIHFGKRDTFSQKAKCREDTYEFKYFIN